MGNNSCRGNLIKMVRAICKRKEGLRRTCNSSQINHKDSIINNLNNKVIKLNIIQTIQFNQPLLPLSNSLDIEI